MTHDRSRLFGRLAISQSLAGAPFTPQILDALFHPALLHPDRDPAVTFFNGG